MPEITLRGRRIEYEVRRSSEASRSRIDVRPSGVRVTVPDGSGVDPEEFLEEKRDWVVEKHGEVQAYLDRIPDRELEDGGTLPVLGRDRVIRVTEDGEGLSGDEVRIRRRSVERSGVEEALEEVLREEARERVHRFLSKHGDAVDGEHDTVYIRNQETKWASCSSKTT